MRVLIISPHFPPTNAADHQRVRLVLPYLAEHGCQAEVLAVEASDVAAPRDEWLERSLPSAVPVHRVHALGLGWGRIPGLGTITFRAVRALRLQGDRLLKTGRFDLVYFSTTQFGLHVLGPYWVGKFGVPFAMDYQDPWVNDYYRRHPEVVPPGGRFKYALADWLNRRQEPRILRYCAGITTVSADYLRQLSDRYPWLKIADQTEQTDHGLVGTGTVDSNNSGPGARAKRRPLLSTILQFPGDAADLLRVAGDGTRQNIFSPGDGHRHWIYVGRGGSDMRLALRGIFGALRTHEQVKPGFLRNLRLHFIGTSYAAAGTGQKTVEPLATSYGLAGIVKEHPDRLPYSQTIRCLLDADALIVPGSDDPAYTASKIYPYLLAQKPLLAVFHEMSPVVTLLKKVRGGMSITFRTGEPEEEISARISRNWLEAEQFARPVPLDRSAFAPHTAREQACRLAEFFECCAAGEK